LAAQPDVLVALSDTPLTSGSYSQKRMAKSIQRSASWLANILRPLPGRDIPTGDGGGTSHLPNVLVHMAGGITPAARQAFSRSLLEPPFGKEADAIEPLSNLDQGVAGYTFDLAPLHKSLSPNPPPRPPTKNNLVTTAIDLFSTPPAPSVITQVISLIRTSLEPLPTTKPRIVHSAATPHEVLALIRDVGIDLFDAHWAQRAADVGVGLDFVFPAPVDAGDVLDNADAAAPRREIGHNLYDKRYAHDFSPIADALRSCSAEQADKRPPCVCMACAPSRPSEPVKHSRVDEAPPLHAPVPYTRAYLHHLLHTHEMSAHTLLALHNLSVFDAFLAGVRRVLSEQPETFSQEITRFEHIYDGQLGVLAEARKVWNEVTLARGKGRLAREREKQNQDTLGTAVELN
jgi:queuine tRNA-ribosyltransferase